jgi:hypothetical protein
MSDKKWIKNAIKHPGAFMAKAKAAGMSVPAYARRALEKGSRASPKTKRQAALALTLRKLTKHKSQNKD